MKQLSRDEWSIIVDFLGDDYIQLIKPYISNEDYIYLDWIRMKKREEYYKRKTNINMEDLMDTISEKQSIFDTHIKIVIDLINEDFKEYNPKANITVEVRDYLYKILLLESQDINSYIIIYEILYRVAFDMYRHFDSFNSFHKLDITVTMEHIKTIEELDGKDILRKITNHHIGKNPIANLRYRQKYLDPYYNQTS